MLSGTPSAAFLVAVNLAGWNSETGTPRRAFPTNHFCFAQAFPAAIAGRNRGQTRHTLLARFMQTLYNGPDSAEPAEGGTGHFP